MRTRQRQRLRASLAVAVIYKCCLHHLAPIRVRGVLYICSTQSWTVMPNVEALDLAMMVLSITTGHAISTIKVHLASGFSLLRCRTSSLQMLPMALCLRNKQYDPSALINRSFGRWEPTGTVSRRGGCGDAGSSPAGETTHDCA